MLSIFRVITLEGWTIVMYNYFDSSGFIACLYFPVLIIMGSFFLLNLFLAVIMQTFSDMNNKFKEQEKKKEVDKQQRLHAIQQARQMRRRQSTINNVSLELKGL
jgi:uncharacterized membrane protein